MEWPCVCWGDVLGAGAGVAAGAGVGGWWLIGFSLLRRMRDIELTLGTFVLSQMPSLSRRSRISHAKMPGSRCFSSRMWLTTLGVVTRGLEPPIAPGSMEPVSWYLAKILETQPWLTLSWRLISQGLMPKRANSTMRMRVAFGRGRPLTKTPPNWLTSPYWGHWFSAKTQKKKEGKKTNVNQWNVMMNIFQ